ncbi:MAG: alpha-glucosidase [Cellulosilyticum sp.]|nr:alpha-glucosidase [Cellulosilyticum sp.]
MIKKYCFGESVNTGATVLKLDSSQEELSYFKVKKQDQDTKGYQFIYLMDEKTQVFGLGENVRGMNKRGFIYESHCSDDPNHDEGKRSLYGAHNFILIRGKQNLGVFIDFPGKVRFDLGYTDKDEIRIEVDGEDFDFYLICEHSISEIAKRFRNLIGKSYVAPKWALGYQQSRWSYKNEAEVEAVIKGYRENKLPLDAVYLDIDYMERYKDFTVNKKAFPDLKCFAKHLKEQGIRLVPIIDAGVKIEKGYDVYEEGVKEDYFCKDANGKDFIGAVWPGKVHFPDFLQEKTRRWFGDKYKVLMDMGIEGFWNDMNEPALFYSEEGLKEAFEALDQLRALENIGIDEYFEMQNIMGSIQNSEKDYGRMYHQYNGEMVCHNKVHNLYGYNMTKAASEAFDRIEPDKRILLFSRASYIGMHRYGGIWTGDNKSWWSHLKMNIQMMPGLNLCGFIYSGADLGGFGDHATEDLVMRWLEFGIFTPLMRNHAAIGTREQEAYRFKDLEGFRNILNLRYSLMPYLYSEYMKAILEDKMYFRPIGFDYEEDEMAWQVEDQLMVGESMMIAPIYTQNAKGRYVYLPSDMLMLRIRSMEDMDRKVMEKGHHYIEVGLNEVLCFIKPNHLVPTTNPSLCIDTLKEDKLNLWGYVTSEATYMLYQDDGYTKKYEDETHYTKIGIKKQEEKYELSLSRNTVKINMNIN